MYLVGAVRCPKDPSIGDRGKFAPCPDRSNWTRLGELVPKDPHVPPDPLLYRLATSRAEAQSVRCLLNVLDVKDLLS